MESVGLNSGLCFYLFKYFFFPGSLLGLIRSSADCLHFLMFEAVGYLKLFSEPREVLKVHVRGPGSISVVLETDFSPVCRLTFP